MKKRHVLYTIGLAAVAALLYQTDWPNVLSGIRGFNPAHLVVVCALQVMTLLLIAFQWRGIAAQLGVRIPFWQMFAINLAGTFVECVTPAVKAGGEAYKVVLLKEKVGLTGGASAAVVATQKALSSLVFAVLCTGSLLVFAWRASVPRVYEHALVIGFICVVLTAFLLIACLKSPKILEAVLLKVPFLNRRQGHVKGFFKHFQLATAQLSTDKVALVQQLGTSCVIWLLFPIKTAYIAYVLGVPLDFATVSAVTYLTYMIGMVPLLPGGIGSFEAAVVFLLMPFGVTPDVGMALALVLRFVTFWFVFGISAVYMGIGMLKKGRTDKRQVIELKEE